MMNAWKRFSDGGERARGEEEWGREEIRDKRYKIRYTRYEIRDKR
jgi:hypothetical protein